MEPFKDRFAKAVKISGYQFIQYIRWLLLGTVTGVLCGIVCALFSHLLTAAAALRAEYDWIIFGLPLGGLLIVFLYKALRSDHTKGTDQIIDYLRGEGEISLRMGFLIYISTAVTILFGGSVGRESAALQIGGSIGHYLGKKIHLAEEDKKLLVMCGMSAAFSALFGTPMAASFFAIEVANVGMLCYGALVPCICASLISLATTSWLGAEADAFHIDATLDFSLPSSLQVLLLAACCALISILFCSLLTLTHHFFERTFRNAYLRVVAGGLALIALTLLLHTRDYLGTGMNIIEEALSGSAVWYAFLLKMLFTAITISAGYKGGEIVPSLFIGATFGCVLAPLLGLPASLGAAIGMVSLFCGVTNCPVSSLLIAFEMFGLSDGYYFLIAVATSYVLSGYFGLYHSQRIAYSKYTGRFIDHKTGSQEE